MSRHGSNGSGSVRFSTGRRVVLSGTSVLRSSIGAAQVRSTFPNPAAETPSPDPPVPAVSTAAATTAVNAAHNRSLATMTTLPRNRLCGQCSPAGGTVDRRNENLLQIVGNLLRSASAPAATRSVG